MRTKFTKEMYIGKKELIKKSEHAEAYMDKERLIVALFRGKAQKPLTHYRFETYEKAIDHIESIFEAIRIDKEGAKIIREERKLEKQKIIAEIQVGDLFSYSWGYNQTQVEFFQCTKKTKGTFTVARIAGKTVGNEGYSIYRSPMKDEFLADFYDGQLEFKKVSMSMPHGILSATTESGEHYETAIGYGH